MRQFQSMSRGGEARDFNLIQDNSSYVQAWSMAQIVVVILCTVVQVGFITIIHLGCFLFENLITVGKPLI